GVDAAAGFGPWRDVRNGDDHMRPRAFGIALCGHLGLEPDVGQIRPIGVAATVKLDGHDRGASADLRLLAWAMMMSPSLSTNRAPSTVRLMMPLRRSRSSRTRRTSPIFPMVSSALVITGLVTPSMAASPRTVCG